MTSVPLPASWAAHVQAALLQAVALAHRGMCVARGWAADSPLQRVRLRFEVERLAAEVGLLREELRIKDARLARIPPRQRPHYPPADRFAILALRAARGWSMAQVARRFLLTDVTIAGWMKRLDEGGEAALVRTPIPVNRFPDFVHGIVTQLRAFAPAMGKVRIAHLLARAGLHLAPTTVRRWTRAGVTPPTPATPAPAKTRSGTTVVARRVDHVWGIDLSVLPTSGRWTP